jgi:hypothetical protein
MYCQSQPGSSRPLARNSRCGANPFGTNVRAATSSRGGIELLADNLVDPAAVARHLEAMRRAEQWIKVSCRYP